MALQVDTAGSSNTGKVREKNEDQYLIADLSKTLEVCETTLSLDHRTRLFGNSHGKMLMVADGMGGHAAGERASSLAIDGVIDYLLNVTPHLFRLRPGGDDSAFAADLKRSFEHSQAAIKSEARDSPQQADMGTTLTMAYVIWPRAFVVHAGDTRCYLFRKQCLNQVTNDHTLAQQFVDEGVINQQEAESSRWSHMLWNVIGGDADDVQPELHRIDLKSGDVLLLCSDGLTKHVTGGEITSVLDKDGSAEDICKTLIDRANADGGTDNVTVVVAKFFDDEAKDDETDLSGETTLVFEEPGNSRNSDTVIDEDIAPAGLSDTLPFLPELKPDDE